jgi:phosphopentomutase
MPRALLIVLDSVGVGAAPDAADFQDEGSNTVGHIAQACYRSLGDQAGLRQGPLLIPHLCALGIAHTLALSTGTRPEGLPYEGIVRGRWGIAQEVSHGKDSPSGHWEIAGCPVTFDWYHFPETEPCFPSWLTDALIKEGNLPGVLGNKHASGMTIIEDYGAQHMATGKPIIYTSADSVFQIAAHEESFGLERLYALCRSARSLLDPLGVGRVIARPFIGDATVGFTRTGHRQDFAVPPPPGTLLERLSNANRPCITVGKVGDLFAHCHTGREVKAHGNDVVLSHALEAFSTLGDGGLVFANLVDFDTEFGHQRHIPGYAAALESFDRRIPEIWASLKPGDLAIITADHGNDPTFRGTDHTREYIPILMFGPECSPGTVGKRNTFADIGETLAVHLGLPVLGPGVPMTPLMG